MSPDQRLVIAKKNSGIAMVLRMDLQDRAGRQLAEKYAAVDLGLHNVVVNFVAEVSVRLE